MPVVTVRSSHLEVFCREADVRKTLNCRSQAYNFIKTETLAQVFSCEFCEISRNTFFTPASVQYTKTDNTNNDVFSKWKEILSFLWIFTFNKEIVNENLNLFVNLYLQKDFVYSHTECKTQAVGVKIQTGRTSYIWKWFDILQNMFNKWTSYTLTEHVASCYNYCRKITISAKHFYSIYEQIRIFLRICSHFLKILFREVSIFYELNTLWKFCAMNLYLICRSQTMDNIWLLLLIKTDFHRISL